MTTKQLQHLYTSFLRWCDLCPDQKNLGANMLINARDGGKLLDASEATQAGWTTPEEGIAKLQRLVEQIEATMSKETPGPSLVIEISPRPYGEEIDVARATENIFTLFDHIRTR